MPKLKTIACDPSGDHFPSEFGNLYDANEVKERIAQFVKAFDRIKWGWDGDCGSRRLVEQLEDDFAG